VWVSNATAAGNLCRVCHFTSNHYATGSATSGIDSNPQGRMQGGCFLCHGSNLSGYSGSAGAAIRPIAGQDAHGFDAFSINNGTDRMWPTGTAESFKPYGFMRNAGPSGQWKTSGNTWAPKSAPGWTGTSAKCDGTACRSSHGNYTPGGVY
jgi:hypothetical protein